MISDSKLLASAAWDAQSLNELKAKAGEDPAANIRPVARQVEGMFVQMMLKSMRDALPKRWPVQQRAHSPVYQYV
ncbi:Muramidase (flagellum-specific) [Escherichia coli]|uniref:Muramidase (Flagellum-specific) n=1 Tax=Escherichia coli TaxID=562 RepID=A0A376DH12_ECOLX|nr:Muramidase (flagellum-specific) [Escherichia coli]STJ81288.1 Muramidase (flagellum-specific) [Escherichia coli]